MGGCLDVGSTFALWVLEIGVFYGEHFFHYNKKGLCLPPLL